MEQDLPIPIIGNWKLVGLFMIYNILVHMF
jgi:hypothetical protein